MKKLNFSFSSSTLSTAIKTMSLLAFINRYSHIPLTSADRSIASSDKIAFLRALASYERNEVLRNPDYLAKQFISYKLSILIHLHGITKRLVKIRCPSTYYYHIARTKHVDNVLCEKAQTGLRQLVILGAGNDSRPYRFAHLLKDVAIFELDFPGTQAAKKRHLTKMFGKLPSYVTFIPIDFSKQSLKDSLFEGGYDPTRLTFFNWEGVCYFLPDSAVTQILEFIAKHSCRGSSVLFDYIHYSTVFRKDDSEFYRMRERQIDHGEPLLFGVEEKVIDNLLGKHGLELLSDLGAKELERLYLTYPDGKIAGRVLPHFRIVHASVKK